VSSILKSTLGLAVAMVVVGGCQSTNQYPVARTNPTPIKSDQALALRQWDQTQALYAGGAVTAYPTLYPYMTDPANGDLANVFWAPTLFVGQTIALPVTAVATPPWEETSSRGVYTPPTYTADVPLEQIP
jgi:hypothetical protein